MNVTRMYLLSRTKNVFPRRRDLKDKEEEEWS
jgi:hypothetical protein